MALHFPGQSGKIGNGQLFGTLSEDRIAEGLFVEKGFYGVSERLSALVERRFYQ
jgi:hypothetical protein